MGTLVLIIIAIVVIYYLLTRNRKRTPAVRPPSVDRSRPASSEPKITVSITPLHASPREEGTPDSGRVTQDNEGGWCINPRSPLPLTLAHTERETAETLRKHLNASYASGDHTPSDDLVGLVARSNVRCKEIDEYASQFGAIYRRSLDEQKAGHPEWSQASKLDREDLLTEFRQKALGALPYLPCQDYQGQHAITLFEGEPGDVTVDDALIDRYGFANLRLYFNFLDDTHSVLQVAAESGHRKGLETLVTVGLARRGKDIPLAELLASLRLKDLNEFTRAAGVSAFTRKAKAVEHLVSQPSTTEEISNRVAVREYFQLLPLPEEFEHVSPEELAKSWQYAEAVATILAGAYLSGLEHLNERQSWADSIDDIRGWEVTDYGGKICDACAEQARRAKRTTAYPRLPLHLGCECHASPIYADQ